MSVAVTGATGFVGRRLVAGLLTAGKDVRILTRDRRAVPPDWIGKVEIIEGALPDVPTIERVVEKREVLYHLAAEMRDRQTMRAVNVEGTRALAEAALSAGVERVVHLSSVGVFGARRPGEVTEATPCKPCGMYERTKWDGEQVLARCVKSGPMRAVILRPTIVFGEEPGPRGDSFQAWLRAIEGGRFVYFSRGALANYVYVGDVVTAMLISARMDGRDCETFIVADSAAMEDFVGAAADELGVPRPTRRVPFTIGYATAACLELVGSVTRRPVPLTRARVRALASHTRYSGARLTAYWTEGRPPFGWREGLRRTVAAYRRRGVLSNRTTYV